MNFFNTSLNTTCFTKTHCDAAKPPPSTEGCLVGHVSVASESNQISNKVLNRKQNRSNLAGGCKERVNYAALWKDCSGEQTILCSELFRSRFPPVGSLGGCALIPLSIRHTEHFQTNATGPPAPRTARSPGGWTTAAENNI